MPQMKVKLNAEFTAVTFKLLETNTNQLNDNSKIEEVRLTRFLHDYD